MLWKQIKIVRSFYKSTSLSPSKRTNKCFIFDNRPAILYKLYISVHLQAIDKQLSVWIGAEQNKFIVVYFKCKSEQKKMCDSNETGSMSFDTKAIHAGQEHDQWKNLEIVPPIVTSVTYYQTDPTNIFAVMKRIGVFILIEFSKNLLFILGILLRTRW